MAFYPRFASALQTLPGDALLLWVDARQRALAFEAILGAAEGDSSALDAAVQRVDSAVCAGLDALGLPRGAVRAVQLDLGPSTWSGRKSPDSTLSLSAEVMRAVCRELGRPDTAFRTWIHESLHARQPFAPGFRAEHARFRGYEEGLAEGLARLITVEWAGMDPLITSYDYYVRAYSVLAGMLDIEAEHLWKRLWLRPPGEVRSAFGDVVGDVHRDRTGGGLNEVRRGRLQMVADRLFDTRRSVSELDEHTLRTLWRAAFREA